MYGKDPWYIEVCFSEHNIFASPTAFYKIEVPLWLSLVNFFINFFTVWDNIALTSSDSLSAAFHDLPKLTWRLSQGWAAKSTMSNHKSMQSHHKLTQSRPKSTQSVPRRPLLHLVQWEMRRSWSWPSAFKSCHHPVPYC